MKTGREHRVPLNDECRVILAKLDQLKSLGDGMVFAQKLSDVAASKALKSVSYLEKLPCTFCEAHFVTWYGDNTNFPREVCDTALAHAV
jgi:hypothetical protein